MTIKVLMEPAYSKKNRKKCSLNKSVFGDMITYQKANKESKRLIFWNKAELVARKSVKIEQTAKKDIYMGIANYIYNK